MRQGHIRWWDEEKGEGMVRDALTNQSYYVHWSAGRSPHLCKDKINFEKNEPVLFELHEDSHFTQVECVVSLRKEN